MAKIGEVSIQRSDGDYDDIEVYEPGTFDHDPLLVQLSDGRYAVPYLRPLGDGDTGLLVQDSTGTWWQVNKQGIILIEDWESGTRDTDTWNWTNSDFSGTLEVTTVASWQGSYSLELHGFCRTISMPSYPNPLPDYPELGESFEYYFYVTGTNYTGNGEQYWFHFLVQDCPHHTTTSAGDTTWAGGYTIEAIIGDTFRIQRRNMDGTADNDSSTHLSVNWSASTWYRVKVGWNGSYPEATLEEHTGSGNFSTIGTATTNYASPWNSGGLGPRCSSGGRVHFDHIRKIPS